MWPKICGIILCISWVWVHINLHALLTPKWLIVLNWDWCYSYNTSEVDLCIRTQDILSLKLIWIIDLTPSYPLDWILKKKLHVNHQASSTIESIWIANLAIFSTIGYFRCWCEVPNGMLVTYQVTIIIPLLFLFLYLSLNPLFFSLHHFNEHDTSSYSFHRYDVPLTIVHL